MLEPILAVIDDPSDFGKMVGIVFWMIVSILGIIKCFSIARRETTSSICVHSLTLALFGYVGLQTSALLKKWLLPDSSATFATILLSAVVFVVAIVGLTLAVIGLAMYRRSFSADGTKREYTQGKSQAGWAVALNLIFILLFVVGFLGAIIGRGQKFRTRQAALESRQSEYVFQENNFLLSLPDQNWVQMDAKTINPESSIVMMRRNPQIYTMVIAELPGVEAGMTVDQLVEIAQSNTKALSPAAAFSEVKPYAINGLEGRRYTVDAMVGNVDVSYLFWCCENNGYCYQVLLWSARKDKDELLEHADSVLQGFNQIDSSQCFYSTGGGAFGEQSSELFCYAVDLKSTDWLAWKDLHVSDKLADCGGVHPDGTRFCVTPLLLPFPEASMDIVHKAFLELYEYTAPLKDDQVEAITAQGMPGLAYSYSNSKNSCIEQLLLATNCAYLVSVWRPLDQAEGLEEQAARVFEAITFSPYEVVGQALEKLPADRRVAQGEILNRVGLGYYNAGRFPEAIGWFGTGHACDVTNVTYFGNILAAHAQIGQSDEGLALLETAPPNLRESPTVKSWEASLLAGAGKVTEADAVYAALFKTDYRDDDDFIVWTELRANNGLWDGLDDLFVEYMEVDPSVSLRAHQLSLHYAKGDYQKVADLAQRFLEQQGFSADIAYWLIDARQELGLYNEALAVCDQLVDKGYVTVDAYQEKAVCEYRLKWYRQAKASLETALKLNPRNETTQEWLGVVSAELGEGDNSYLKEFIDPVVLHGELAGVLESEPKEGFGQDFGAYYSLQLVLWHYEKGKKLKRTDILHIKVLDEAGISSFSSLEYAFNPVYQNIFVNELLVRDGKGEVVGRGAVKDYYVLDDDSDGLVSEKKKLVLPVPGLQPGCSIEVVVTRAYSTAPDEFYFKRHFLAAGYPVLLSAVFLGGEADAVAFAKLNNVHEVRQEKGVLWKGVAPYVYKWEPKQIPAERFVPGVVLGSSSTSWKDCGQTYLKKIKDRLTSTSELRQRAVDLAADCNGDGEKFMAIVDWIRSSFTYKPLEFGRSASIPDSAATTVSYRYGDCKDLSVLLKVLLEAVDVECHLVLVNSSDDIYPEIATTDQFNHVIVFLPGVCDGLFVDPTDQEADAFLPVPQGLQKRKALVLDPDAPQLVVIPEYEPDSSACSIMRSITVEPGKPVAFEDQISLRGYYASWMRSVLKGRQKVKWVEWLQKNVAGFVPGLEVKAVSAKHVTNSSKDLQLEISYVLRNAILPQDAGMELDIPPVWVQHYLSSQNVLRRKNPFWLNYPLEMELSLKAELSEGYRLTQPLLNEAVINSRFIDVTVEGSRFSCRLKSGTFDASEYADFVDTVNRGIKAAHLKTMVLKNSSSEAIAESFQESAVPKP